MTTATLDLSSLARFDNRALSWAIERRVASAARAADTFGRFSDQHKAALGSLLRATDEAKARGMVV